MHDGLDYRARPPAQRWSEERGLQENQAIGRSRGGLSTKTPTAIDARGNPTSFYLTPGHAPNLDGADILLKDTQADCAIADRANDAQARVIGPLQKVTRQ